MNRSVDLVRNVFSGLNTIVLIPTRLFAYYYFVSGFEYCIVFERKTEKFRKNGPVRGNVYRR
jgi:hypothetical protein